MKYIDFKDVLSSLLSAVIVAIFATGTSLIVSLFTINGGIDYFISDDRQNFYITVSIYNSLSESVNIEVGLDANIEQILSSSGNAGIDFGTPQGRAGSVVSISKIPQKSDYVAILKGRKGMTPPIPTLISAPSGFALTKGDAFRGRINYWQVAAQGIVIFAMSFLAHIWFEKQKHDLDLRMRDLKENLDRRDIKIQALENRLTGHLSTFQRFKLHTLAVLRGLRSENEFWRLNVERFIVGSGASKTMAKRLLGEISKRFGSKTISEFETDDLDIVIDIMIDEEKRKRFDDLTGKSSLKG